MNICDILGFCRQVMADKKENEEEWKFWLLDRMKEYRVHEWCSFAKILCIAKINYHSYVTKSILDSNLAKSQTFQID